MGMLLPVSIIKLQKNMSGFFRMCMFNFSFTSQHTAMRKEPFPHLNQKSRLPLTWSVLHKSNLIYLPCCLCGLVFFVKGTSETILMAVQAGYAFQLFKHAASTNPDSTKICLDSQPKLNTRQPLLPCFGRQSLLLGCTNPERFECS